MTIRSATTQDIDELARIEALAFPATEAASKERISERIKNFPDYCWILEDNNMILSYINGIATNEQDLQDKMYEDIKMHNPAGKHLMIFSVVTNPEYLHQGYATKLMNDVLKKCSQTKVSLVLTCKEKLIGFYEKFGYQDEGISASLHGGVSWHQMRYTYK